MTHQNSKTIESLRRQMGDLENDLVDAFLSHRIDRRDFIRAGSVLGLTSLASVLGVGNVAIAAEAAGGTLRVAHMVPAGVVDPLTVIDGPGTALISQTGEYLIYSDAASQSLKPSLATAWQVNDKGDVWTFKLRNNVKFHDGRPMTAKDVVATFDRLTDKSRASAALSIFRNVLSKGGVKALDDFTVQFHLDGPNGNFPYYVSSDTANAVILPNDYVGNYEQSFIGTGPFKLEKYQTKIGASFIRNPDYWGTKARPDRVEFMFYADQPALMLALQGGRADVMTNFSAHSGLGVLNNPAYKVLSVRSSSHRQMHMKTDVGPFKDKRLRQALSMTLDRDLIVKGLLRGWAVVGNDSPFAPVFPSTDGFVPQRKKDIEGAKKLLAAAGVPNGFKATLTTERFKEIPDLAVVIQNGAKEVGIDIELKLESQELYYGSGKPGRSDWLDSTFGITDYGHRGVPNVLINAPYVTGGAWNSSHFANETYDRLVAQYTAALDLTTQRRVAGQMQRLLLDETPIIIPYFLDSLMVTKAKIGGVKFSPIGQVNFSDVVIG